LFCLNISSIGGEFGSAPGHYGDDQRRYNEQDDENERHVKTISDRYEGGKPSNSQNFPLTTTI